MSRKVREYFEFVSPQWDLMRKNFYGEEVREAVLNGMVAKGSMRTFGLGSGSKMSL